MDKPTPPENEVICDGIPIPDWMPEWMVKAVCAVIAISVGGTIVIFGWVLQSM